MKIKDYVAVFIAIAGLTFTSCSDDNSGASYDPNGVEVANAELKTKLQALGYNFNEKGNLLQDEKVQKTTSLDLSNANLTSAKGLDIFPNLTEVKLSNNKFGATFDFSQLPAKVNSVDLTDNDIYEFKGLVDPQVQANGDEDPKALKDLTKLELPATAKYDCNQLIYLKELGKTDMQIEDANGKLNTYTTLRDIPNQTTLDALKKSFPNFFSGNQVDLSKRVVKDNTTAVDVESNDVEGVQYIINHRSYKGSVVHLTGLNKTTTKLSYLKLDSLISELNINYIDTPNGIDFSDAKNIVSVTILNNPEITTIDLSKSTLIGQRATEEEYKMLSNRSNIDIESCPKFKRMILPDKMTKLGALYLIDLPQLEKLDLSKFETFYYLDLANLSGNSIVYPEPKYFVDGVTGKPSDIRGVIWLGISKDVYDKKETQDFLKKYSNKCVFTSVYVNGKSVTYDWTDTYPPFTK